MRQDTPRGFRLRSDEAGARGVAAAIEHHLLGCDSAPCHGRWVV